MPHSDELLGVADAARILAVSPRTVKRLLLSGDLPHRHKARGTRGAYVLALADVESYRDRTQRGAA